MTRSLSLRHLKDNDFFQVFNFRDDLAKGRSCMIFDILFSSIASNLITGIFFTGFLLENGIDMVDIGYVTSIPLFCSLFSIFTPVLLSRFKRRKFVLCAARFFYYSINILGITAVPILPLSLEAKKIYIVFVIFICNTINQLFATGFTAWHSNFLGDDVRPKYFSYQQIISGLAGFVTLLVSGLLTDAVSASDGSKLPIMMVLRLCAFFFVILDVFALSRPKEYEYKTSTNKVSVFSVFTDPFRYKNFMLSMIIVFMWTFSTHLSLSAYEVYALNELKVSYTVISTVNAAYGWFIFFIVPFWRKHTLKHSWYRTLLVTTIPNCLTYFIGLFIVPANGLWLYPIYRLIQHVTGVGFNYAFANIAYVHLPEADRTSCLTFHALTSNAAGFLGQIVGTAIISATKNITFALPGLLLNNVKIALLVQCIWNVLMIMYVCRFTKKLGPTTEHTP